MTALVRDEDPPIVAPFVLDEASMTAVVQDEWLPLVRLAALLLNDRGSAEDVVQEVCEAVWRRRPAVTDRAHLVGYLRTAVVNRARSAGRKRRTMQRYLARTQPDHAPPADLDLLVAEEQRLVLDALARLPARQREVLVLRYWSELSEAQIAETLGIAPGTVKSTAHHALANLHRLLKGTR